MALSADNLRRQEQVNAGIQVVDPQMTPQVLARHPRYPQTETLQATYLSNCGLGFWTSGDAAEQSRRNLARAVIFLKQVMGGSQAQAQIALTKADAKEKKAPLLSTELTALVLQYRAGIPSAPVSLPRVLATQSTASQTDITPQQSAIVESAPLTPVPRDEPPQIPVAPPPPDPPPVRMFSPIRHRVIVGANETALRNRAKWMTRPSYALQWSAMAEHPDDFPFRADDVNSLLTALDSAFTALDLAALLTSIEKVRTNIDQCFDASEKGFTAFNKVVAEANAQKQKYIGLAMTIVGGALSAVGGPLGGLVGKLLVEGVQRIVTIAIDAAAVSAKATELGSGTAAQKATDFIQAKLQNKLFLAPQSDASLTDLKTKIRLQFTAFYGDVTAAIMHGINEVTGVVKVPEKPVPTTDQRRSAAMALLWKIFDKKLKLVTGTYLLAATQDHVTALTNDVIATVNRTFAFNRFQFADIGDMERYFELRYLARLVLDLAAANKSPPDAVVNEFERLNILGKWTNSLGLIGRNSEQQRRDLYNAGKIRYGRRHVSEREKLMLRTMCKYIDQRVQPMDIAMGRKHAADLDNAMKQYARNVTDYVEAMKSQGSENLITAATLEALTDTVPAPTRARST